MLAIILAADVSLSRLVISMVMTFLGVAMFFSSLRTYITTQDVSMRPNGNI